MTDHLRFSGVAADVQLAQLRQIIGASPVLMAALRAVRQADLPDAWIVSGAIYNQVWNALTGRAEMHGVKDVDVFYFDTDASYKAEDAVIQTFAAHDLPGPPIEVRNQARVHLWYETHFGVPCAPIKSSADGVDHFASRTHCVAARLVGADEIEIYAPFGLDDIFSFRLTPNPVRDNRETHHRKGARQQAVWPELTVVPWPSP